MKRTPALLILLIAAFVATSASAQAGQITGIADENLDEWSPATWSAFEATGVKQVRHVIPWDTALHTSTLNEATAWIDAAEAHGLSVLISFNHNSESPPSPQAYLNAVGAFREHFPEISTYTAWNEPNHDPGNAPGTNPTGELAFLAADYWYNLNFVCGLAGKYGSTCTVIAGDFSDETSTSGLRGYIENYKGELTSLGASPGTWAVHAYKAIRTNSFAMLDEAFFSQVGAKPVWFTEAGGMVCNPDGSSEPGYTGAAHTLQSAEAFQSTEAQNYLALISHEGSRIERSYYYSFSATKGGTAPCVQGNHVWDSNLVANEKARSAYAVLFPGAVALKPPTVAFQANTGALWTYFPQSGGNKNIGLGMAGATSPAIGSSLGGSYDVAFQANTGALWTYSSLAGNISTTLGMTAATSPAVAKLAGGGYMEAFQANTGTLWTYSPQNGSNANSGLGMAKGTSPGIAGLTDGSYDAAFQANSGALWTYSPATGGSATTLGMAPGTSPSIAGLAGGGYEVAFQTNANKLWMYSPATGNTTTTLGMAAGTSPSIAATIGGYQVAFQASTGTLWVYSSVTGGSTNLNLPMAAGTSPSITWVPSGYQIAYQTNGGSLATYSSITGASTTTLGMATGTSPSIAPE